jgi:DNA-binding Lrp family transcriptional regulator
MKTAAESQSRDRQYDGRPDELDRRIIKATQRGLPLAVRPYDVLAEELDVPAGEIMARLTSMRSRGIIRRIAAVPNHYALGYRANGMSVWNVPDADAGRLGRLVGALDFVSHCYLRPRHLPQWPYNLFAMVHGRTRESVEEKVAEIAALLDNGDRGHEVLYSKRILKKTGLRIA